MKENPHIKLKKTMREYQKQMLKLRTHIQKINKLKTQAIFLITLLRNLLKKPPITL